jgi:hypothetical protein
MRRWSEEPFADRGAGGVPHEADRGPWWRHPFRRVARGPASPADRQRQGRRPYGREYESGDAARTSWWEAPRGGGRYGREYGGRHGGAAGYGRDYGVDHARPYAGSRRRPFVQRYRSWHDELISEARRLQDPRRR